MNIAAVGQARVLGLAPERITERFQTMDRTNALLRAVLAARGDAVDATLVSAWRGSLSGLDGSSLRWKLESGGRSIGEVPENVLVDGYVSQFRIPMVNPRWTDLGLETDVPEWVERTRSRQFPRSKVGIPITATIGWQTVDADILEVSLNGCVIMPHESLSLMIGDEVSVAFALPDAPSSASFLGVLVRVIRDEGADRYAFSVKHGTELWRALVLKHAHVSTVLFPESPEQIWNLFRDAGYLSLSNKSPDHFAGMQKTFLTVSKRLKLHPELACQVSWPKDDTSIYATLTQLKLYSGTWFAFHLAKVRETGNVPGRSILRGLNSHAVEHLMADADCRHMLSYIQDGTPFSKLIVLDFAERYESMGLSNAVRFEAYEVTSELQLVEANAPAFVRKASPEDLAALTGVLEGCRAKMYIDALDLDPEHLRLDMIRELWARAGLYRERVVFAAGGTEDEAPTMFAVVEAAEKGLHIFGLLNCVRLYGTANEAVVDALMGEIRVWFRKRTFEKFVVLDEGSFCKHSAGAVSMGWATCSIIDAKVLPDYLEHFFEWLAWAPAIEPVIPAPVAALALPGAE
jgi:hypothetical protein